MSRTKEENDKIRAAVEADREKNRNAVAGTLGVAASGAGLFLSAALFGAYTAYHAPLDPFQSWIAIALVLGSFAFMMLLNIVVSWVNDMERKGKI